MDEAKNKGGRPPQLDPMKRARSITLSVKGQYWLEFKELARQRKLTNSQMLEYLIDNVKVQMIMRKDARERMNLNQD